jgi:hypothetical protein
MLLTKNSIAKPIAGVPHFSRRGAFIEQEEMDARLKQMLRS